MFEWYEVTALLIGLGGLVLGKRRIDLTKLEQGNKLVKQAITEKKEIEARLKGLELRMHHLDNPETGRVHKISKLCENQIETNKKAYAMAYATKENLKLVKCWLGK